MQTSNYNTNYTDMNNYEILHNWANRKFKGINTKYFGASSMDCTKDQLWYNGRVIARFLNNDTVIIEDFDHRGAFGSGFCSWNIKWSIPRDKESFVYTKLLTDYIINNEAAFKEWYAGEFIHHNNAVIGDIALIKEFATNNQLSAYRHDDPTKIKTRFLPLPRVVYNKYRNIIKDIDVSTHPRHRSYYGWGYRYNEYALSKTVIKVKDLHPIIKISKFIDRGTIAKYRYRVWHVDYCRGYMTPTESKKIYDDKEARTERETRIKEFRKQKEEEAKVKAIEKDRQALLHHVKKVEDWKKSDTTSRVGYTYSDYGYRANYTRYQAIKKIKNNLLTSDGVMVPIEEAKKAFRLFNLYKDKGLVANHSVDFRIGGFHVNSIGDVTIPKIVDHNIVPFTCKAITVGCHVIPDFEIDDFIKRYDLKW